MFLSGTLPSWSLRTIFNIFRGLLCLSSQALQRFISFGPRRHSAEAEHLMHHTEASPFGSTLLTMSCPPKCASLHLLSLRFKSFPNHLGPSHVPATFIFLLLLSSAHAAMFAGGCTPLCATRFGFSFLVHEDPVLFGFRPELFCVLPLLHQTRRANLLAFPLDSTGPDVRHLSSIQHCSVLLPARQLSHCLQGQNVRRTTCPSFPFRSAVL